jgi:hypothetical protein
MSAGFVFQQMVVVEGNQDISVQILRAVVNMDGVAMVKTSALLDVRKTLDNAELTHIMIMKVSFPGTANVVGYVEQNSSVLMRLAVQSGDFADDLKITVVQDAKKNLESAQVLQCHLQRVLVL